MALASKAMRAPESSIDILDANPSLFVPSGVALTRLVVSAATSRRWTSALLSVSPSPRLVAKEMNATRVPSPLTSAKPLSPSPFAP